MTTTYHLDGPTVALLTTFLRMPESVVRAWLSCEGQDDNNLSPNNPLNVMVDGTPGQSGRAGHGPTALYPTLATGAHWTAWLIDEPDHVQYAGIRAARSSGDPYQIARAIELSPWAGGHYGATPARDGCIAAQVRGLPKPKPAPAGPLDRQLNPVPLTCHRRLSFGAGTHLYRWPGGPIERTLGQLESFGYIAATAEWLLVGKDDTTAWIPRGPMLLVEDLDLKVGNPPAWPLPDPADQPRDFIVPGHVAAR